MNFLRSEFSRIHFNCLQLQLDGFKMLLQSLEDESCNQILIEGSISESLAILPDLYRSISLEFLDLNSVEFISIAASFSWDGFKMLQSLEDFSPATGS